MALRNKLGKNSRATRSTTARGEAVTRGSQDLSAYEGGTPAAAQGASYEELQTQSRLEQQREAQREAEQAPSLTEAAARRAMGEKAQTDGVFTAVVRNGLPHRRNGIMFGAEPVTVDISDWNEAEKQRFFDDSLLMIVPGQHLSARGAMLVNATGNPAQMTGGAGENATPQMIEAAKNGRAMPHPSFGSANPVIGGNPPSVVNDLEKALNGDDDE